MCRQLTSCSPSSQQVWEAERQLWTGGCHEELGNPAVKFCEVHIYVKGQSDASPLLSGQHYLNHTPLKRILHAPPDQPRFSLRLGNTFQPQKLTKLLLYCAYKYENMTRNSQTLEESHLNKGSIGFLSRNRVNIWYNIVKTKKWM